MKLIKCFLIAYFLLAALCPTVAGDFPSVLQVKLRNNTVQLFVLSDKPQVTFDKTKVFINSSEFSSELSDVLEFMFVEAEDEPQPPTSLDQLQSDVKPQMTLRYIDGKTVEIISSETPNVVSVYSINGMPSAAEINYVGSSTIIDLSTQPSGVYIIKVNSQSFKIRKR